MIKLLIADDEPFVRQGLIKNINWLELGVGLIEQADDGVNALKKSVEFEPDILLADVRMPNMNGIELANKIRYILPDCKIIFMSAYSDKEYLKSAITLKAMNYIEKPINLDEISNAIANAVKACIEEAKNKVQNMNLQNKIQESIRLIKNNIALQLVDKHMNRDQILKWLDTAGIDLSVTAEFIVAFCKFKKDNSFLENEPYTRKNDFLSTIQEKLTANSFNHLSGFSDVNSIVTVIFSNKGSSYPLRKCILERIFKDLINSSNEKADVFISIGKPVYGIENVIESYQTAMAAGNQVFFKEYGNVFIYKDEKTSSFVFNESFIEKLIAELDNRDKESAIKMIKELTRDIRSFQNNQPNYIKNVFHRIILQLSKYANNIGINLNTGEENSLLSEYVSRYETLQEYEDFIIEKINLLTDMIEEKHSFNRIVLNAIKIINKEYSNPDLSIKSLSESLYISQVYFCILFKKEMGKAVNQYITEYRVEKAKKFLKEDHIKLYEIASRVGYTNQNYFSKVFKKIVHVTPKEYREKFI